LSDLTTTVLVMPKSRRRREKSRAIPQRPNARVPIHQPDDEPVEVLPIVVDYSPTPFGTWLGVLNIPEQPARRVQAADAHQTLHAVLDELEIIADETRRNLATVHQLDGDPEAWARLAVEKDFVHCATQTGHEAIVLD
jgi:hypothetical protein